MPEKINEDDIAKEAIANSPDVTAKVEKETAKKSSKDDETIIEGFSDEEAERNGRLISRGIEANFTTLQQDQVQAFEELGTEFFKSLNEFGVPKPIKIGLLIGILLMPFLPSLLKIKRGSDNGNISNDIAGA
tara:strand:- start:2 stop:397 length:396 start_codon:yes stop_codon:yes gene_type:complete